MGSKKQEKEENTVNNRTRGLKKPWEKGGKSPNPKGRPLGSRNFKTVANEALKMLAKLDGITPEEAENKLVYTGLLKARTGQYQFYKDFLDRIHGMAVQKVGNEDGQTLKLDVNITDALDKIYGGRQQNNKGKTK